MSVADLKKEVAQLQQQFQEAQLDNNDLTEKQLLTQQPSNILPHHLYLRYSSLLTLLEYTLLPLWTPFDP